MKQLLILVGNELKKLFLSTRLIFLIIISAIYIGLIFIGLKVSPWLDMLSFLMPSSFRQPLPYQTLFPLYIGIFLIPIITILFSYDSISSIYEKKSLKLLAYRIKRYKILLSRILSVFIVLFLLNAFVYIFSTIYFIKKNGIDYSKIFLMFFLLMMIYSLLFLFIGIMISILSKKNSKSLFLGLFSIAMVFAIKFVNPLLYLSEIIQIARDMFFAKYIVLFTYIAIINILGILCFVIFNRMDIE